MRPFAWVAQRASLSCGLLLLPSTSPLTCTTRSFASSSTATAAAPTLAVDHYKRLGVDWEASAADVKAAYRRKALECHPDVVPSAHKAAAEADFRRVSESYSVLSNPKERSSYDERYLRSKNVARKKKEAPAARTVGKSRSGATSKPQSGKKKRSSSSDDAQAQQGPGAATTTSPTATSTSWATPSAVPRRSFVRKDADRLFRDAFDGRTLDDILFQVRFRERHQSKHHHQGDAREEKPAGHEEVLHRVMADAAKKFADRVAQDHGHESVKLARFFRPRSAPAPPPSNVLPFRPFRGTTVPDGVLVPEDPQMGTLSHIGDEEIKAVHHLPPVSDHVENVVPRGARDPTTRATSLRQKQLDTSLAHNAGQMYTYHRPY